MMRFAALRESAQAEGRAGLQVTTKLVRLISEKKEKIFKKKVGEYIPPILLWFQVSVAIFPFSLFVSLVAFLVFTPHFFFISFHVVIKIHRSN